LLISDLRMADSVPIKLQELVQLTNVGVQLPSINFGSATMESDKYITVREITADNQVELVVFDMANPLQPVRRPIQADSALMNPAKKILAIRAGNELQLFDFEKREVVKSFSATEQIVFWTWVSDDCLGMVTQSSIYHWKLSDSGEPVKVFERHESLASSQIINYRTDEKEEWMCVVGIEALEGGLVGGSIQLYSTSKQMSQVIEGHAASFARLKLEGYDTTLFIFASLTKEGSKLHIIEVGHESKPEGAPLFDKRSVEIYYPLEAAGDFPVALQVSSKYSIVYLITKLGYVHLYDIDSATPLYANRVSETTLFATCAHAETGGLLGLNRAGQVLLVSVVSEKVIPYVLATLKDVDLAGRLASRNGFPGAENMFVEQFEQLFEGGNYREAAIVAADSPAGLLRTAETIGRFKALQASEGGPSPLLMYFQTILERGRLNKIEALEMGVLVTQAGKGANLEKWLKEDKMECSEELGDLVAQTNLSVALGVYIKAKAHLKVITTLIQVGQTKRVHSYIQKVNLQIDQTELVQLATQVNPQAALELANFFQQQAIVVAHQQQSTSQHYQMFDMFVNQGLLNEGTNYCLDNLTEDIPEYGDLQTKVLELNLMNEPQIADAILGQDIWHHYDKQKIAMLCERQGLFQHALENFQDLGDVKRVITNTHILNPDFLLGFFGTLAPDDAFECLKELLENNAQGNLQICVSIGGRYGEKMGVKRCMDLFGGLRVKAAQFMFLGQLVNFSEDPEVHFRYIEASVKTQQYNETERVTRESNYYDPEKTKKYLIDNKVRDPRPLINVCDRFGYIEEMTRYFMKNGQWKFVEGFLQRINPNRTPQVVGVLLDLDYKEDAIKKLILSVKNTTPIAELVAEVQKRGRIKILLEMLESKVADGVTDADVHSGLAMVYTDLNINAEHFLLTNVYYDSRVVGPFCEKRDPYLAYVAYRRGVCDSELFELCLRHQLYKELSKYLVDREDSDLWAKALNPNNQHRKLIIDQVTNVALMEVKEPEKVASTIKAFLEAQMPEILIQLLEKLTLDSSSSSFARNQNLQNLLILTSMKTDKKRVPELIRRLDNYAGDEIATIAIESELYDEAYLIYHKMERYDLAVGVLVDHVQDLKRAEEYAMKNDLPAVWSRLGLAQVEAGKITEGINSIMKAQDFTIYEKVINASIESGNDKDFEAVVKYLKLARNKVQDVRAVDTEIVYALCRTKRLPELEEFVKRPHAANLDDVTERCLDDENWLAARFMCKLTKNFAKLAAVYVHMGDLEEALKYAKQADRVEVWRTVLFACVDAREFRFAQTCGQKVIVETGELPGVIEYYERPGYFFEAIELVESGLGLERANPQMFTELGVLLTKYRESQMMDFCKMWWQRASIPRLLQACEQAMLWAEKCYLHQQYNEHDLAIGVMIDHAPDAWNPSTFTDVISKVGTMSVMYDAIDFYVEEHPELLNDLLFVIAPKCEATTAMTKLRDAKPELGPLGVLPLCKAFLRKVQDRDVSALNEALNDVLILEENVEELSESTTNFKNFEHMKLARKLETHAVLEMRKIAVDLYKRVGKYEEAIELCKKDKLYKDAINVVAASKDQELTEALAEYFLSEKLREAFSATLFTCFEYLRPDIALELSWLYEVMDFAMPFMIQTMKEVGQRVIGLEEESEDRRAAEEKERQEIEDEINDDPSVLLFGIQHHTGGQQGDQPLALTYNQGGGANAMVPQLMWPGAQGNQPAQMNTFVNPAQAYQTAAVQQAYQTAQMQQAYATQAQAQAAQAAYATQRAAQQAYVTQQMQQGFTQR